jgi:tetratricopeptide (TPR) repeat protein
MELAYGAPRASLQAREERLKRLAHELGVPGFEPVATALLLDDAAGSPLERSRLAVAVAPGLPAAHAFLASALLADGAAIEAARAALRSIGSLRTHLDSRLWLDLAVFEVTGRTLSWAGMLFLVVLGASVAPRAAHDLGDLAVGARPNTPERTDMPGFARGALLAGVLLLPVALGEGALGAALALFGIAVAYGDGARRLAAVSAAALILVALYPLGERHQRVLASVVSDPVPAAAYAALHSVPPAQDAVRLEHVATERPAAALALALLEMRAGRIERARGRLAPHVDGSSDPALLNQAANLDLLLGNADGAIALYERAAQLAPSPQVLFNLSQAYGRGIRLQEQEAALARAQALDPDAVTRLVVGQAERPRSVVDLSFETATLLDDRVVPSDVAGRASHPFAPGRLGSPVLCAGLFLCVGVLAAFAPRLYRRSRACKRCGARRCPRCDTPSGGDGFCGSCARLTHSPETTDPGMRTARLADLRRRERRLRRLYRAISLAVPGSSGLLAGRPILGLVGTLAFAGAAVLLRAPVWVPPDPGTVGGAASVLFGLGTAAAALVYVASLLPGLRATREKS